MSNPEIPAAILSCIRSYWIDIILGVLVALVSIPFSIHVFSLGYVIVGIFSLFMFMLGNMIAYSAWRNMVKLKRIWRV